VSFFTSPIKAETKVAILNISESVTYLNVRAFFNSCKNAGFWIVINEGFESFLSYTWFSHSSLLMAEKIRWRPVSAGRLPIIS